MSFRAAWWLALAAAALPCAAPAAAQAAPALVQPASLEQRLAAIAKVPTGRVGIAAIDLSTGREVAVNGGEALPDGEHGQGRGRRFLLAEVDAGRRSLAKMISARRKDAQRLRRDRQADAQPGRDPVRRKSDRADAGGQRQYRDRHADRRPRRHRQRSSNGSIPTASPESASTATSRGWCSTISACRCCPGKTAAQTLWASDPLGEAERAVAVTRFDTDPRDTATPLAFARFLARLDKGEMLKPASRTFLFAVMSRCRTGLDRIPGGASARDADRAQDRHARRDQQRCRLRHSARQAPVRGRGVHPRHRRGPGASQDHRRRDPRRLRRVRRPLGDAAPHHRPRQDRPLARGRAGRALSEAHRLADQGHRAARPRRHAARRRRRPASPSCSTSAARRLSSVRVRPASSRAGATAASARRAS